MLGTVLGLVALAVRARADDAQTCLTLPLGRNYTQAEAPRDISLVKQLVLERIHEMDNLERVRITYTGSDIQGLSVGQRLVKATIKRATDEGLSVEECVMVSYWILDTDECSSSDAAWRHACDASAQCVNTDGAYECACVAGFGVAGSGSRTAWSFMDTFGAALQGGLCWGHADTASCCHLASEHERCDVRSCTTACLANFKCADACAARPCAAHSTCVPKSGGLDQMWAESLAERSTLGGGYECVCDAGYELGGDGACVLIPQPDWCASPSACPCNCECKGGHSPLGYTCEPRKGYKKLFLEQEESSEAPTTAAVSNELEPNRPQRLDPGHVCVDATVPSLALLGESPYRLRQGDEYREMGCDIIDPNSESFRERHLTISFPSGPLGKCLSTVGEFTVRYELDADYGKLLAKKNEQTQPVAAKNRSVLVSDVDECAYTGDCPQFVPTCAANAKCVNTPSAYTCKCPEGYEGDGHTPGTGCADRTPPVIACSGAGCRQKLYRATDIHGIVSDDGDFSNINSSGLAFVRGAIAQIHADGIARGVDPFCETTRALFSKPCFTAHDDAFVLDSAVSERVELTRNVTVGTLTEILTTDVDPAVQLQFRVEYAVRDAAGNAAAAHRDIIVVAMSDSMQDQLRSGAFLVTTRALFYGIVALLTLLLAYALWTFSGLLAKLLFVGPFALAYAVLDRKQAYNFLRTRDCFVGAVDLWLFVTSFGRLSDRDRLRAALFEWTSAQQDYGDH